MKTKRVIVCPYDYWHEAFLEKERKEWSCRACGGPGCVHNGLCSVCGQKNYE